MSFECLLGSVVVLNLPLSEHVDVIGNIHNNPELLGEQ